MAAPAVVIAAAAPPSPKSAVPPKLILPAAVSIAPPVPASLLPPVLILLRPRPGPLTVAAPAVVIAAAAPPSPKLTAMALLTLHNFLVENAALVATAPPASALCPLCKTDAVGPTAPPPAVVLRPRLGGGGGLSPFFFGMVR